MNELLLESPQIEAIAKPGWSTKIVEPSFPPDGMFASVCLVPEFPYVRPGIAETDIVWNLDGLVSSVSRPGSYELLTCTCESADHQGINAPVHVAHPDESTVVWELDSQGLSPAFDESVAKQGFVRLIFDRGEYEESIHGMIRDIQRLAFRPLALADHINDPDLAYYQGHFEGRTHFIVDGYQPGYGNTDCTERINDALADADWKRRPLFEPGTLIEIGLFGDETARVNGVNFRGWVGRWIMRWSVYKAWYRWPTTARWCLRGWREEHGPVSEVEWNRIANESVIKPGTDPDEFHELGRQFVRLLQASFDEGSAAPGVEVHYIPNEVCAF